MAHAAPDASVVPASRRFTNEELSNINSVEDARRLLGDDYTEAAELGNGFTLVDKSSLVGVPLFLIQWKETIGDFGAFMVIHAITKDGKKVVITDGSTGIKEQLASLTEQTGRTHGLAARNGLRVSEYDYEDGSGNTKKARTYYIDTNAD